MTDTVRRDLERYIQEEQERSQKDFLETFRTRLAELKVIMEKELEVSTFNKKKTPMAVFNYLVSILEKNFDFISEQPLLYAALLQIRDDELLQCLLNISIYLGTIDKPETFIADLKRIYTHHDTIISTRQFMLQQLSAFYESMNKKDHRKMRQLLEHQLTNVPSLNMNFGEQTVSFSWHSQAKYLIDINGIAI